MPQVLVVDDDHGIRVLMEDVLRDAGFDVTTIASARDAVAEVNEHPPALLILDLSLPDGSDEMLRDLMVACERTPVMVLSGAVQLEERAADLGAQGFLAKPFDLDEFIRGVKRLIEDGGGLHEPSQNSAG